MKIHLCLAAGLALAGIAPIAEAKVTRLEIASKQPYGSFRAGDYVRWDGRIVGELAPVAGVIPDLEKAPRNANGKVE